MEGYDASTYGDRIAEFYDEFYATRLPDAESAASFLAELAGPGPALELAIGTGRIARPLTERGVEVHGIDASERMVAKLRAKPGGDAIPVTLADFADVGVEGRYRLVFLVFNTLFALTTQEAQIRCLMNVGAHLTDDGVFVIEAFVPDLGRFDRGQRTSAVDVGVDRVVLEASTHDPVAQTVSSLLLDVSEEGLRTYPVYLRYAWPAELDLMARLAGLRLRERWGGWSSEPFTADSGVHVSVYERA